MQPLELDSWQKSIPVDTPTVVVDGAGLLKGARTLLVGYKSVDFNTWPGTSAGDFLVDVRLRGDGIVYRRLFNLARFRTVSIPCEPFTDAYVRVTDNDSSNFSARVVASSGQAHPGLVERVSYGQSFGGALADVVTPYGAVQMTPLSNDAGFTWHINGLNFPRPLTAGTRVDVLGTSFNVTTGNTLIWEIQL